MKPIPCKNWMRPATALFLSAVLAACAASTDTASSQPVPSSAQPASGSETGTETTGPVTFTDALGHTVTVESLDRVVALYGSFAETWTLAGGTLVGSTDDAIEERGMDLGPGTAVVGTTKEPNTEEIFALDPDLILLSAETASQVDLDETLTLAGIPHAYLRTNTFEEYLAALHQFCVMTGREDLYEQNGLAVQRQIQNVIETVEHAGEPNPTVLFLRAYSGGCKAKGSDSMTGAMLADLGAENIADRTPSLLEDLSMEEIITADPDFILVTTMGQSTDRALEWVADHLQSNPTWSGLKAVQEGHYYVLPKELFHYKPNARWGESYETLAALLYPELF